MDIRPETLLLRLRENHLPTLSDYDQRLLTFAVAGYSADEIAALVHKHARSVRRDLQRVSELVCLPAGAARPRASMVGWWFHEHWRCAAGCLPMARALVGSALEDHDQKGHQKGAARGSNPARRGRTLAMEISPGEVSCGTYLVASAAAGLWLSIALAGNPDVENGSHGGCNFQGYAQHYGDSGTYLDFAQTQREAYYYCIDLMHVYAYFWGSDSQWHYRESGLVSGVSYAAVSVDWPYWTNRVYGYHQIQEPAGSYSSKIITDTGS